MSSFQHRLSRFLFGSSVRLRLYEKMAEQLEDGVPLQRVVDDLWKRTSKGGTKPNKPAAKALASWRTGMRNGKSLGDSLGDWVAEDERLLIQANEAATNPAQGLRRAAALIEAKGRMRGALIGGLAYPVVLVVVSVGVLFLFGTQIIPQFALVLPTEQWTGAAASMASLTHFVQNYMAFAVSLVIGLIVLYLMTLKTWKGKLRSKFDRFPPWSLYRLFAGSGFLQALAAMNASGVQLTEALTKIASMSSPWARERIMAAHFYLMEGKNNLGEALEMAGHGFPDQEIIDDLHTYSASSSMDVALERISKRWMENGEAKMRLASRVMFVASLAMMGGLVGWIITGFYSIQQQVGQMANMGVF